MTDVITKVIHKTSFDLSRIIGTDDADALADFMERAGWRHSPDFRRQSDEEVNHLCNIVLSKSSYLDDHYIRCEVELAIYGTLPDYEAIFYFSINGRDISKDSNPRIFDYLVNVTSPAFRPSPPSASEVIETVGAESDFGLKFLAERLKEFNFSEEIIRAAVALGKDQSLGVDDIVQILVDPDEDDFVEIIERARNNKTNLELFWGQFGELPLSVSELRDLFEDIFDKTNN